MIGREPRITPFGLVGRLAVLSLLGFMVPLLPAQVAIHGKVVHTMTGPPIEDGVVVIRDGKISAVGKAADVVIPAGFRRLEANVVTPGLIDAHSVVGLGGIYNNDREDQDQLERSEPTQPELRAIDAYNPRERLVQWVREFGITTVHTGHAPGELVSGQTCIVKTTGNTVGEATIRPVAMVAATLASSARKDGSSAPGTRAKMMSLLRQELIAAQEYRRKVADADPEKRPSRDLSKEAMVQVLERKVPLLVTAQRAQDIANALRLAEEFKFRLVLDGAAEAYLLLDEIEKAGVPVIIHPTMMRAVGDLENLSFETAAKLADRGIPVALQSGFESYVPKTRVVLFEAGMAAANGLGFERALATITRDAAEILGIDDRVGTLAVGKDGDVALFDGDPFEYTTHVTGVVIEGEVVSETVR